MHKLKLDKVIFLSRLICKLVSRLLGCLLKYCIEVFIISPRWLKSRRPDLAEVLLSLLVCECNVKYVVLVSGGNPRQLWGKHVRTSIARGRCGLVIWHIPHLAEHAVNRLLFLKVIQEQGVEMQIRATDKLAYSQPLGATRQHILRLLKGILLQ